MVAFFRHLFLVLGEFKKEFREAWKKEKAFPSWKKYQEELVKRRAFHAARQRKK